MGVLILAMGCPSVSDAQFLRLGPFDMAAEATLEGVYTTNVEQERESESEGVGREDYFIITGLALSSPAKVSRNTTLNLQSAVSVEKHFNRPDLDNSSNPFGLLSMNSESIFGHYTMNLDASIKRESESQDRKGVYVPGDRKMRDVSDAVDYGGQLRWQRKSLQVGGSYTFSSERHQDEEFQDGDQDETTIGFDAGCDVFRGISLSYEYERKKTELLNAETEPENEWEVTESFTISMDETFALMKRPRLTYSFSMEKEDTREEDGEWEPVHRLSLTDEREITSSLRLALGVQYEYEDNKEEDDITLTYNGSLEHQLARTARQRLSASREPVRTFGSTTETDNTTIDYNFTKTDLFIYNLTLNLSVGYTIDDPLDENGGGELEMEDVGANEIAASPTEKVWTYTTELSYARAVTRKIQRMVSYTYTYEDSNLETEILDEHRVTLSYIYTF